jgi:hypothetical protein
LCSQARGQTNVEAAELLGLQHRLLPGLGRPHCTPGRKGKTFHDALLAFAGWTICWGPVYPPPQRWLQRTKQSVQQIAVAVRRQGDQEMPATLKLTHKAIGAEVRRGTYDAIVDGAKVGSVEMNSTVEMSVEPGRHTLQVRDGRKSNSIEAFDAADGEIVAFRCTGKRFLPIFLASFIDPKLALKLVRD